MNDTSRLYRGGMTVFGLVVTVAVGIAGCGAPSPDEVSTQYAVYLSKIADTLNSINSIQTQADANAAVENLRELVRDSNDLAKQAGKIDTDTKQKLSDEVEKRLKSQWERVSTRIERLQQLGLLTVQLRTELQKMAKQSEATLLAYAKAEAKNLIETALDPLQVERLGVNASIADALPLLNRSNKLIAQHTTSTPSESEQDELQRLLPKDQLDLVLGEHFTPRDADHLWGVLLCAAASQTAIGDARTDLERVVNVFHFVNRNVALEAKHPHDLPLTLHVLLYRGKGTAHDRAWVFASILRQLQIDAVLIGPQGDASPWIVGVLLADGVYLFDPRLGQPVPTAASAETNAVATLRQVIADESLLSELTVDPDKPYPLSAELLKASTVRLIGDTSIWSPRMRRLQPEFAGARSAVIHREIEQLVKRVKTAAGGLWKEDNISVWQYPEQQLQAGTNLNPAQRDRLAVLKNPFRAAHSSQLEARALQLSGNYKKAKKLYTKIRLNDKELRKDQLPENLTPKEFQVPVSTAREGTVQTPDDVANIIRPNLKPEEQGKLQTIYFECAQRHHFASVDAAFWTANTQWQEGEFAEALTGWKLLGKTRRHASPANPGYTVAIESYLSAVKKLDLHSEADVPDRWAAAVRKQTANALAAQGKLDEAIDLLKETPSADPSYDAHRLLIRRLQQMPKQK